MNAAAGAALLLAALAAAPARAGEACPPGLAPAGEWPSAADAVRAAHPAEAAALDAYAFTLEGPDAERRGRRTDALLVVHRGVITYERYGRGFGPATPHLAWSAAKSVTGALAGLALARGALALDDSVCRHLSSAPPDRCGIRVRDLLESASGLDWTEAYEGGALQASSVLAMLYGEGSRDMAAFVLSHGRRAPPGQRWAYSSGDSVLLAAVVDRALRAAGEGEGWPRALLFEPLGMESAVLERDRAGTPVGSSWLHATPRDLARFGWLLLEEGCWRGRRLLPAGWVREAAEVAPAFRRRGEPRPAAEGAWGRALWLNRPVPELGLPTPWPGAPEDAFAARGHWGQLVLVIPSLELVVVRTADDRAPGVLDLGRLAALAIAAGRLP